MNQNQVKKGYLTEIGGWLKRKPGGVKLQVAFAAKDDNTYLLECSGGIYPDNGILSWLDTSKVDFSLEVKTDEKTNS